MTIKRQINQTPKVEQIPGCKGNEGEQCNITKDVVSEATGFIFDRCETCYGTFNSRKQAKLDHKKTSQRSLFNEDRKNKEKIIKEKPVEHVFPYHWYLKDGYPSPGIEQTEYTEFGTFICGGGSTMGFKMAGFNSIGGVEIDPKVAAVYKKNHNPKYLFVEGVKEFKERVKAEPLKFKRDYRELFNLDVFSGSPPCSSFSMSGDRGEMWGVKKKFREGQAEQVLDTLFFDTIELIAILQPKIVSLENVKGILAGDAKQYVKKIYEDFDSAGYEVRHFVLNARDMGVPQARERVFFLAMRKDIIEKHFKGNQMELFSSFPMINLSFSEPDISFQKATREFWDDERKPLTETSEKYYDKVEAGKSFAEKHPNGSLFNWMKVALHKPAPTLACENRDVYFHPTIPGVLNDREYMSLGSFPLDYDSLDMDMKWFVGMSVPPVMMAQIAYRIKKQWLDVIYKKK